MRMLLVGGKDAQDVAKILFADAFKEFEVDVVDKKLPKQRILYDGILVYHTLERLSHRDVPNYLKDLRSRLKPTAEMMLFVKSLEWAAEQILGHGGHELLLSHLFGFQTTKDNVQFSGYTAFQLRALLADCGLAVKHMAGGEYVVERGGEQYVAEHMVVNCYQNNNIPGADDEAE